MRIANGFCRALFVLLLAPALVYAAPPAAPKRQPVPQGMGEFILVLWPPGSPVPGDGATGTIKLLEPDIEKLGGKVIEKDGNRHLIHLPLAAAHALRQNADVVYLQRVWRGESLTGWDEKPAVAEETAKTGRLQAETDTDLVWGPKDYSYDSSGNIKQIGDDHYTYDSAGRLIQAVVDGKTESYQYDSFGNLVQKGVSGANPVSIPVDGASNRMIGVTYDAAGNATTAEDGRRTYKFDSFNTLTRVTRGPNERRMIYDADDERIGMIVMAGSSEDTLSRWHIRDFQGRIIREYKGSALYSWTWEQDHFYAENTLVGGETPVWGYNCGSPGGFCYGGRRHYHLDHLGSVRLVTNDARPPARARTLSEHEYYPFGVTMTRTYQEQLNWGDPHIDAMRYAGHWRDFLGDLNVDNTEYIDFMHARYYDPDLGRFLSIDPQLGDIRVPQSWNRYAYVMNNPVRFVDPRGRDCTTLPGPHDKQGEETQVFCTEEITVRGDPVPPTNVDIAVDVAKEWLDITAMQVAMPYLHWAKGALHGDVKEIGLSYAQQLAMAAPGGVLSGMTGRLGTMATESLVPSLDDAVLVIGKYEDTAVLANTPGHEALRLSDWSLVKNDAWIARGIQEGRTFYLASEVTEANLTHPVYGLSAYGRELAMLMNAGYRRVGMYLVPK